MDLVLQFAANGIMVGGIYALISLGIVLIYKSSKVFNFAVGEMVMLGAFFMWTFFDLFKLPLFIGLFLTVVASGIIGLLMERLAIHPLIGQPLISAILVTLGLSDILRGLAMLFWGERQKNCLSFFLASL